jgi:hypothetical protein
VSHRCVCTAELSPANRTAICAECVLEAKNGDLPVEVWLPIVGFRDWEMSDRGRPRGGMVALAAPLGRAPRGAEPGDRGDRPVVHTAPTARAGTGI